MKDKLGIVIAEDHAIVRDGLKALLSSHAEFEIKGEARDGYEAIRCVRELKPDLVLLDLSMPRMNGMEAMREIKKQSPETKILVLTVHKMEKYVHACLKSGADGYVLKDATSADLVAAIKSVLSGKRYLSPDISGKVIDGYLDGRKNLEKETSWDKLTDREREILKLVAEGYKNREIADYLCISLKTVETHRENLKKKLNIYSTAELTAYAMQMDLIID